MKIPENTITWPKLAPVVIKGFTYWRVDARRAGTSGKRETYKDRKKAEQRQAELAKQYDTEGSEGLAIPAAIRGELALAKKILEPFPDATLVKAAEHYRDHLLALKAKENSSTVTELAKLWREDATGGKTKKLRPATIKGIKQGERILASVFSSKRVQEVTTTDVRVYLDKLPVGLARKKNIRVIMAQFFNWCIEKKHLTENPCASIEYTLDERDVSILTPDAAENLLRVCEEQFPKYVLYMAISMFAGLRPTECKLLRWEQVHAEESTITVLRSTSKINETRNVHIEETLDRWLTAHRPAKAKGYITPQGSFPRHIHRIHVAAGYRGKDKNKNAGFWPKDITRHSYGSYWLAKYGNRAQLAEYMGNSVQVIKKHYKQVVSKSAVAAYWSILPSGESASLDLAREADNSSGTWQVTSATAP